MNIYLDHAATTPLSADVLQDMMPYLTTHFGNASSLYRQGQIAREALDDARFSLSENIDANLDEIYFTSGATESNTLALCGVIKNYRQKTKKIPHVITSNIEHPSVQNTLDILHKKNHIELHKIPVENNGIIDIEKIKNALQENTLLVSIIAINNEIGSIQPLSRIGKLCRKHEIYFHVDAVQAVGQIKVSAEYWKADMISLSAHKFYGPKGAGMLYVRSGTEIESLQKGGGQERGYRGGTENVAGIIGMQSAFEKACDAWEDEKMRLGKLQKIAKNFLEKNIESAVWNGPELGEFRSTANINFSLPDINGESLLMRLDLEGIAISLGSACSSGMMNPSHVLLALGRSEENAQNAMRLTFGKETEEKTLMPALQKITEVITQLKK